MAVTFQNLGLAEPSTITARVATVQIARGSTNEQQEILVLGDPESSLGIARVVAAAPDSTHFGLVTRQVGYTAPSTTVAVSTGSVRVHQSTAADLQATVAQASTVWAVQLSQYSTTVNVSSLAGRVAIAGFNATDGIINVTDSTNTALRVNVVAGAAGGSTDVSVTQLRDSSGGSVSVGDSANNALRVNVVAGAAGGSTIVSVSTGSVRVHQSTATDLNVTVGNLSTNVSVSTGSVRVHQSTGNDHKVSESAGTAFTYGQITLSSTPTQVTAANTARKRLVIVQHSSAIDVYLGASTVSVTTGLLLAAVKGNQVVFRNDDAVYGISTGGAPVVSFAEETH